MAVPKQVFVGANDLGERLHVLAVPVRHLLIARLGDAGSSSCGELTCLLQPHRTEHNAIE